MESENVNLLYNAFATAQKPMYRILAIDDKRKVLSIDQLCAFADFRSRLRNHFLTSTCLLDKWRLKHLRISCRDEDQSVVSDIPIEEQERVTTHQYALDLSPWQPPQAQQ